MPRASKPLNSGMNREREIYIYIHTDCIYTHIYIYVYVYWGVVKDIALLLGFCI